MSKSSNLSMRRTAGMSLIEVMIGLAIGMFATIVMLQMFSVSESRNRAAVSSGNAQSNGVMVFYQLQSDINRAGYGFNSSSLFNCPATWNVASAADDVIGDVISKAVRLAPVSINPIDDTGTLVIPAGDADTDTLLVMYGNGSSQPEGNQITTNAHPNYAVQMASSFAVGDRVIAATTVTPPGTCVSNLKIDRVENLTVTTSIVTMKEGTAGDVLFNLGPGPAGKLPVTAVGTGPTILAYAIRAGNLTACNFMLHDCSAAADTGKPEIWEPLASDIVSLRAQYGRDTDTPMNGIVDAFDQTTPTTSCDWTRVSAVRLVLVARSPAVSVGVTSVAPVWIGTPDLPIDLTAKSDWQNYRYKLFQAVMPIRNVAWMSPEAACPAPTAS